MRKNIVIGVLVIIVGILLCTIANMAPSNTKSNAAAASTQPTATPTPRDTPTPTPVPPTPTPTRIPPTPTPTHTPQWTTIQTFSGNGNKKTTLFTVPDTWRFVWSCNPASAYFGEYNVMVDVKGSDGSDVDLGAVNTICKAGNTGDSTQEYQGGDVYLDVNSEDAWTIKIQVLK